MYTLINSTTNHDTIQTLDQLLQQARDASVVGVATVVILRERRYLVSVTGEAYRNPTFTRGALAALDDELRGIIHANSSPPP